MILPAAVLRLLPHRLQTNVMFDVRKRLAGQDVVIPSGSLEGFENLAWAPSWRSEIFGKLLPLAEGALVDVGANMGQSLLDQRLTLPGRAYVGFEPNVFCMNFLKRLLWVNDWGDCRLVPVALSDRNTCLAFFRQYGIRADQGGSIVGDLKPARAERVVTDTIPAFRFDDLHRDLELGPIALVKIDVEGAELGTLRGMEGALARDRPPVLCEVLLPFEGADLDRYSATKQALMGLLDGAGYAVLAVRKTAGGAAVAALSPVSAFPLDTWTEARRDECDYLFVPRERLDAVRALFPG
jgi:FkbM family methyltransferase